MSYRELTVRARRALMTLRARAADEALIHCEKCGRFHDENDDRRFEDVAELADQRGPIGAAY